MNPKILLAFVGGAVVASGIVYFAGRPDSAATPARFASSPVTAEVTTKPADQAGLESAPPQPLYPPDMPRSFRREKPSPASRQSGEVARVTAPSAPVIAQPAPSAAPVRTESEPPPAPPESPAPPPAPSIPPPPPKPNSVTIQPGTTLSVRIGETISTQKNQPGDTFMATLSEPLVVDGFVLAERGSRAQGKIVEAERAGKVKGVSHLTLELTKINTSDGQSVPIRTVSYIKEGQKSIKKDAAKVGIGAALGAIIGAAAGGGKGAAIGTGAGGAAGAGDVLLTRGPDTTVPVETKLTFKLQEPVTITERLH